MTTWCELQEVESPHVDELNTWEVTERPDDTIVFVVYDQWATTLAVAAIAHLALAGPEFPRVGHFDNVSVRVEGLEECYGLLGLFEGLGSGGDDERNFLDLLDAVSTGKDQRGEGGCSESGNDGEATLVLVYFDMPLAPGLGGGKHATATAHVSECSLRFFGLSCGFELDD